MSAHEPERLSAYLDDELAPGERAAVEAHLQACPECTAFLAELAAVDEAAAAMPAEAPEGYFETFPARVRARLQPRKAGFLVRRVPAWTWAAAAALLLAVITPLTLRQGRPAAYEARRSAPQLMAPAPAVVPPPPTKNEPEAKLVAPELRATPAPPKASWVIPTPPPAPRGSDNLPALEPPETEAAPREKRDQAAEGRFAREPAAPPQPGEAGAARKQAAADAESDRAAGGAAGGVPGGVVGGVVGGIPQEAPEREKAERPAPEPGVTAESAAPLMAASAVREATPAILQAQKDAFRRLEAVRPRTPAGWRSVRDQWIALAAAEADAVRADEARVRAIIAAREAWKSGGDEGDESVFRGQAESYLRRDDARQKPRVERLLAEAAAPPAP